VAQQLRLRDSALKLRTRLAQPGRYAVNGLVCALAHNAVMIGGDAAGLHYLPATILSFFLVGGLGYALHVKSTFRQSLRFGSYARFMAGLSLGFPVSLPVMFLLCDVLKLPVWIASPVATLLLFLFNYVMARWAIMRRGVRGEREAKAAS
jgi:putative flippase GtrA